MKELEEKIMAEVLHIIHDHEYSLTKVRETVSKVLKEAYNLGWDKNTEEHLGIKLKPLQCEWCSKRFNGEPLEEGEKYYCNKCLKL
jgi:hypothetical protein